MVWPGPSSRASRMAPAMLMPVEPPRHRPSSCDQVEDDRQRFLVGDLEGEVRREAFEIGGDAALPDAFGDRAALGLQLAFGVEAVERRAQRIGERDLDVRVLRLQADARRRPACRRCRPPRRSRRPCRPVCAPDLLRRGADMAVAVGDIVELVGPDRAVRLALAPAARPAARTPSRSCSGSCRARPEPRSARRRARRSASFFSWLCVSGMTMTVR